MNRSRPLISISGLLIAMSNMFKMKQQILILEVWNHTKEHIQHIIVPGHKKLSWLSTLECGKTYSFNNLCLHVLYPDTADEREAVRATSRTQVQPSSDSPPAPSPALLQQPPVCSYQGRVTSVDAVFDVYTLDDDVRLVLYPLTSVTNCPRPVTGDTVIVHRAHWLHGRRTLAVCSRSTLTVLDRSADDSVSDSSSTLHTLHTYSLPVSCIDWYRRTVQCISHTLIETQVSTDETESVMRWLLSVSDSLPPPRSLVKEFISRPHSCVATGQFVEPFHLRCVCDLVDPASAADDSVGDCAVSDSWLLATAHLSTAGRWTLQPHRSGTSPAAVHLVLLTADVPAVQSGTLYRISRYRVLRDPAGAVCVLAEPQHVRAVPPCTSAVVQSGCSDTGVRVLVHHRTMPVEGAEGARRWFHLHVTLLPSDGAARTALLLLTGAACRLYSQISRGTVYRVLLYPDNVSWTQQSHRCVSADVRRQFPDCIVLKTPDEIQLLPAPASSTLTQQLTVVPSVTELKRNQPDVQCLTDGVSVRGLLVARTRVNKNKYNSDHTTEAGQLRLVLCDLDAAEVQLVVFSCERLRAGLPAALLPGAVLQLFGLRWSSSRRHQQDRCLVITDASDVCVVDWSPSPVPSSVLPRPRLCLPRLYLSEALSSDGVASATRWLCVGVVSEVRRATVRAHCGVCGGGAVQAGRCQYVGCHAGAGGTSLQYTARARLLLDDGTACVPVYLRDATVYAVLAGGDALREETAQCGEMYYIQAAGLGAAAARHSNSLLALLCNDGQLRRSRLWELKKLPHNADSTSAEPDALFCEAAELLTSEHLQLLMSDVYISDAAQ